MLAKIISFVVIALVFSAGVIARPGGNVNASLVVESNDNIGNAAFEADKREDVITELHLGYRGVKLLERPWALFYGVDFGLSKHQDFDLLDATTFDAEVGLAYKSENTFAAPTYRFTVNIGTVDTDIPTRDADYVRIGLSYSKRLTDKLSFLSGLESYSQEAKRSVNRYKVFDLDRNRFYFNLDYKVAKKNTLYLTYSFLQGEVISVGDDANPVFDDFSDSRVHDGVFGPRGQSRLYAYRLEADTNILNIGYNIAVSRKAAIDLAYQYIDSSAENNISYETNRISLAYLHRF